MAQVTDVLEHLLAEFGEAAELRPVLFQAALRVCAEESRRARHGQPAPLEALVARARVKVLPVVATLSTARREAEPEGEAAAVPASGRLIAPPPLPAPAPDVDIEAGLDDATGPVTSAVELDPVVLDQDLAQALPAPVMPSDDDATSRPGFPSDAGTSARDARGELPARHRSRRAPFVLALGALALAAIAVPAFLGVPSSGARSGAPAPSQAPQPARSRSATTGSRPTTDRGAPATGAPARPGAQPARSAAAPVAPAATAASVAARPPAGWAETMPSPDWVGRAPIYAIHFSSYRQRNQAERDASRVGRQYGRPAYTARVTIPGRGDFYRVVLGDFESAAAARSFRSELIAAGNAGVAAVYWVVPAEK